MGAHDFKLYNMPFFARKLVNFNVSRSAAPELMSAHDFKLNKVPVFALKCAMFH